MVMASTCEKSDLKSQLFRSTGSTIVTSSSGGLNRRTFQIAKDSGPFHCPSCRVNYLSNEISNLKRDLSDLSNSLSSRIAALESRFSTFTNEITSLRPDVDGPPTLSGNHDHENVSVPRNNVSGSSASTSSNKLSIVISGISECCQGTRRSDRISYEFDKVSSVICPIDPSVTQATIKDCRRLEKIGMEGVVVFYWLSQTPFLLHCCHHQITWKLFLFWSIMFIELSSMLFIVPLVVSTEYHDDLIVYLMNISNDYESVVIMGDFNAPDIDWHTLSGESDYSIRLCDLVFDFNLSDNTCPHPQQR
uniref:Endonuclease/exonuclease/phosphatase domain-containing protein n=1 Tax=Amphimedon queenslandica TaxID=400682 RepID=A0A1X7TVJ7_AMPQE